MNFFKRFAPSCEGEKKNKKGEEMDWKLFLGKFCKVVVFDCGQQRVYSGKIISVTDDKLGMIDKFGLPQVFAFSLIQKVEVLPHA